LFFQNINELDRYIPSIFEDLISSSQTQLAQMSTSQQLSVEQDSSQIPSAQIPPLDAYLPTFSQLQLFHQTDSDSPQMLSPQISELNLTQPSFSQLIHQPSSQILSAELDLIQPTLTHLELSQQPSIQTPSDELDSTQIPSAQLPSIKKLSMKNLATHPSKIHPVSTLIMPQVLNNETNDEIDSDLDFIDQVFELEKYPNKLKKFKSNTQDSDIDFIDGASKLADEIEFYHRGIIILN
jgi:hypothetical protein